MSELVRVLSHWRDTGCAHTAILQKTDTTVPRSESTDALLASVFLSCAYIIPIYTGLFWIGAHASFDVMLFRFSSPSLIVPQNCKLPICGDSSVAACPYTFNKNAKGTFFSSKSILPQLFKVLLMRGREQLWSEFIAHR